MPEWVKSTTFSVHKIMCLFLIPLWISIHSLSCAEASCPNIFHYKALKKNGARVEGKVFSYISKCCVGDHQTIGIHRSWQCCCSSAQWSDWLDTKALLCPVMQLAGRRPSTKSLTEDYIPYPFPKCHLCINVSSLLTRSSFKSILLELPDTTGTYISFHIDFGGYLHSFSS